MKWDAPFQADEIDFDLDFVILNTATDSDSGAVLSITTRFIVLDPVEYGITRFVERAIERIKSLQASTERSERL